MGIEEVHKGCKDKAAALRVFADRQCIPLDRICFIGDDVNDLSALKIAGIGAAPANAQPAVLAVVTVRLAHRGGDGAVRELIDLLLAVPKPD